MQRYLNNTITREREAWAVGMLNASRSVRAVTWNLNGHNSIKKPFQTAWWDRLSTTRPETTCRHPGQLSAHAVCPFATFFPIGYRGCWWNYWCAHQRISAQTVKDRLRVVISSATPRPLSNCITVATHVVLGRQQLSRHVTFLCVQLLFNPNIHQLDELHNTKLVTDLWLLVSLTPLYYHF